jgi:hypothetical protein
VFKIFGWWVFSNSSGPPEKRKNRFRFCFWEWSKQLLNVDEMFFRRLLNVPVSVPKEGIYLDTGKLSVKYIVRIRRMMH